MGFRDDLTKRIERKRGEIAELETQVRIAKEYLQALEDMLKIAPRDVLNGAESPGSVPVMRPGTALAKSRDAIRKAGRPLHITELLTALGKGHSRNERAGLSGTLATYVRRGEIFTRPAPNTFGLVEMPARGSTDRPAPDDPVEADEPPPPPSGFGKL